MKNLASFLLSVMLICFSACSNNDDLVEVRQQVTPLKNLARSTTFNYQGKNYTSEFNYTNDSSIVYIDKEVQKTAEKLDKNPILVTFFNAGIITYYDNESEFNKTLNINTKTTRASRLAAEATFYKDTNYNGAELKIGAGNYPDLGKLAEKFEVPFKLVSCDGITKEEQEKRMMEVIDSCNPDYVILAKYMRILSPEFVNHYPLGKIINIHHSFLPAFIGAKPYLQAYNRGVKIIGATAHFVTNNLDEGPIIEQDVIKVNHRYDPETLAKAGHDVEQMVLMRAVNKVLDDKVFIHGNKTVVF